LRSSLCSFTVEEEIVASESKDSRYTQLVNYFHDDYLAKMTSQTPHLQAWRAVVTSHAAVTDRVQTALAGAALPPLSWFELMRAVKRSPTGRPRMSELAEWLTLSRGGITKLVDRLEDAGYLARVTCSEDRRSLQAELTPAGERMLDEMREVYESVLERYLSALTEEEAALVSSALEKVTGSTCEDAAAAAPASVPVAS
jgi:DNA-binding MarR family transcriptional regulator